MQKRKLEQAESISYEKAFVAPICVAVYEAVEAAFISGVAVATITNLLLLGPVVVFELNLEPL